MLKEHVMIRLRPAWRKTRPLILSLVVGLTFWPAMSWACYSADCQSARVTRTEAGVVFQGMIHADAVSEADHLLRANDRLIIDSDGGDGEASERLGSIVQQRNIKVVVEYDCFSTCAQYVFLAAGTKTVQPTGRVMFDMPSPVVAEWIKGYGDKVRPRVLDKAQQIAETERALYARAGVDPKFVQCLADAMRGDTRFDPGTMTWRMRADLVVFTKDALEQYGVTGIESYNAPVRQAERAENASFFGYRIAWIDRDLKDCAMAPVTLPNGTRVR